MAKKTTKKKPTKYNGVLNEKTGLIDWTSPAKTSTNPTDPPPPKNP